MPRIVGCLLIVLGISHYLPLRQLSNQLLIDLHADLAPELIGIGITTILVDWVVDRHAKQERQVQLIKQLKGRFRVGVEMALTEMQYTGTLYDGTLRGQDLRGINLSRADLEGVDLGFKTRKLLANGKTLIIMTRLESANLSETNLKSANLQLADLKMANLRGADMRGANLIGANISGAIFANADLRNAALGGESSIEQNSSLIVPRVYTKELVIDPHLWTSIIIENRTLRWKRAQID